MSVSKVLSNSKFDFSRLAIGSPTGAYIMKSEGGQLRDISGNANHATYKGAATTSNRCFPYTTFPGSGYVDFGGLSNLSMNLADYSIVLVAKITGAGVQDVLSTFSSNKLIGMQMDASDRVRLAVIDFAAPFTQIDTIGTTTFTADDAWHLFILTIDRDVAAGGSIYIDNVEETYNTRDDMTGVSSDNFVNFNTSGTLGISTSLTNPVSGDIAYFAIYKRVLTSDERTKMYREFKSICQLKGEYGINAGGTGQTSDNIENTPMINKFASNRTVLVTTDTINNTAVKVLEAITNPGYIMLPSKAFGCDNIDAAYGEWRFWMYADSAASVATYFIDNEAGTYYYVTLDGTNTRLAGGENGAVKFTGNAASAAADTWHEVKVTRSGQGVFNVYLNGTLFSDLASGANPFTDTTTRTSERIYFDIGAGCKIAWADKLGLYSMYKKI